MITSCLDLISLIMSVSMRRLLADVGNMLTICVLLLEYFNTIDTVS